MEKQSYIEVSYTSVADMLQKMKDQLIEMKKDHERQVEAIDNDIRKCDIAIAALTPKVEVAAEQPQEQTPEDMSNLHSYLHVNSEEKKPYRIKTRQEMIDGGVVENMLGNLRSSDPIDLAFIKGMEHLHGKELDTNTRQEIDNFTIEPWMITENN